jgi:hypothetical protein
VCRVLSVGLMAIACWPVASVTAHAQQESPGGIIAAQIRMQGYRCDNPTKAQHDLKQSRPNSQVWALHCANASYRVQLTPDMAARVERLN